VPSGTGLAEVVDERFARSFAIDDPASLVAALRDVETLEPLAARAAALEVAERHAPAIVSERFAEGLRARLAGPGSDPS
jgi:hypothetical protein